MPVTAVDAFEAEAFCRYLGKELATDRQWVKAARGGVTLHGQPNPSPRRLYTWIGPYRADCVNEQARGSGWTWPVDSFECGASPYGILNLLGNVEEWVSTVDQPDRSPLRVMRGGHVETDNVAGLDIATTVFVNHLNPRQFYYSIGLRCVEND